MTSTITNLMNATGVAAKVGWIYTNRYYRGAEKFITKSGSILYAFKIKNEIKP
jgi:hypothetical protein